MSYKYFTVKYVQSYGQKEKDMYNLDLWSSSRIRSKLDGKEHIMNEKCINVDTDINYANMKDVLDYNG